jgi:CRISPR system Cascade subunit CasA
MNDLLVDPLFTIETPTGNRQVSLPGLLAALGHDEVQSYPALRRHQQDPLHVFLCQIAAASLARVGLDSAVQPESFWRDALLELAEGKASAWQLVVDDPTLPAFMQSPATSKADFAAAFKPKAATPDELDVLATAKNHDLKIARSAATAAELWTAALITMQTTAGFFGLGNYGIVRMNGGFASRAIVSLVANAAPGPRFREETAVAMICRGDALRAAFGYRRDGSVLTWLKPWPRQRPAYALKDLDPLFIESARATRLSKSGDGIIASGASSKSPLVAAPDNGDTGDPWTVLNTADKKKGISALTLSASGFTPERLTDMLFENGYRLTPMQKPRSSAAPGPATFCASVLVRGQGTTDGFHSVRIPVPEKARLCLFGVAQERQSLQRFAQDLLRDAGDIERSCLKTALFALCEGGPDAVNFNAREIGAWVDRLAGGFSQSWENAYFPLLWRGADPGESQTGLRREWIRTLATRARETLRRAEQNAPVPQARKLRAAVRAESILEAMFHKKGFTEFLKETEHAAAGT